jgi:hypothetical protein
MDATNAMRIGRDGEMTTVATIARGSAERA